MTKVLVIDIGGSNVKVLTNEQDDEPHNNQHERRRMPSGEALTPRVMVEGVKALTQDWPHQAIAIGYPGAVREGRAVAEPHNLGQGWVGFDFERAFGKPVKLINDAAMQALGSHRRGKMLFLGLGTGLGAALVLRGLVLGMELAHLPYRRGTFEDDVGARGLERLGRKKWRERVIDVTQRLQAALVVDEVAIGGGNARLLDELPEGCRIVANSNAFVGGFRLWGESPAPGESKQWTVA